MDEELIMERIVGTTVRGLRAPIFKSGDDLVKMIPDLLENFYEQEGIEIGQKDVVAITESVVARTQGNYASVDQIAQSLNQDFEGDELGIIFPIVSRNRFAIILKAIARSKAKKIILQFSFPADEVGNHLISIDQMDAAGLDPWKDCIDEARFRELFGKLEHEFTGIDYVTYFREIVEDEGKEFEVIFANSPLEILNYTKNVINCDIHTRQRTKRILLNHGATFVHSLDDILTSPVDGSGYNEEYGLLGSNRSTEEDVKLFPRDCMTVVKDIQAEIQRRTGKLIEVMIYGDGAFKDPVGKIWELADPVVSPGFTEGLSGTPNEVKLKYLADNEFKGLTGKELKDAITNAITSKEESLVGSLATLGTTPRQIPDLIGSLADLTSGSGDKGTPIIYIQGYFDNYTH